MLRPFAGLLLLLPLLPACGQEAAPKEVEASAFLRTFDTTASREVGRESFEDTVTHWSRSGLSVSPPDHYFAHWSVTGTISDAAEATLVAALQAEMEAALAVAGLTWDGEWSDGTDREDTIASQILGPGLEDVAGHFARYEHADGEGWVEVLTGRNPKEPDTVTIGCGMHEPTHQ